MINSGSACLDGTDQQSIDGNPAIKPFWEITDSEVKKCIDTALFRPANIEYFRGGGFSADFKTRGNMPVTMFRLNLIKGLGPVLQIAEGYSVELEDKVHEALDSRTGPAWPTTWLCPRLSEKEAFKNVYNVMSNWGGQTMQR